MDPSTPTEFNFAEKEEEARASIETLWDQITALVASVHPIELLCQLTYLQMHRVDGHPDTEEIARWQVRAELVAWHVLHAERANIEEEVFVGGQILGPLEELLEKYFSAQAFCVMATRPEDARGHQQIRSRLLSEALFVRGEGQPQQIRELATGLYGPHREWMQANLGFCIEEAFLISDGIFRLIAARFQQRRIDASAARPSIREHLEAITRDNRNERSDAEQELMRWIDEDGTQKVEDSLVCRRMFDSLRGALTFSADELHECLDGKVTEATVDSFLKRMSQLLGSCATVPDPVGLNPLVQHPLIFDEGRYCLPVPAALYDALLSTFHFDLYGDPGYRPHYDDVRANWLEESAMNILREQFPGGMVASSLRYGPLASQKELDGIVVYDNKVVLVECKWKNLTVSARMGNVDAIKMDLSQSIKASFDQAVRAREAIRNSSVPVLFTARNGTVFEIDPSSIGEIYCVSILGRGGLSIVAANLPSLAPAEMFPGSDYPWAISLLDLATVCQLMELPSQLFDYIRRRDEIAKLAKLIVHDEWDLLGLYFDGHLDKEHLTTYDADKIVIESPDSAIDRYLRSKENSQVPAESPPARQFPQGLKDMLWEVERMDQPGRTDFIVALLSLPDVTLRKLWRAIQDTCDRTKQNGRLHSVCLMHTPDSLAICVVATQNDPEDMAERLEVYCLAKKYRTKVPIMLGIGIDLALSKPPHAVAYLGMEWREDIVLEAIAEEFFGPEGNP